MAMPAPIKALLFVLFAVFGSSAALFTADGWRGAGVWNVAILTVGALFLWLKKNTPAQPWAKFLIGVGAAGATVLVSAWTDHRIEPVELQQIVLAVLGAAMVGAANEPAMAPVADRRPTVGDDAAGSDAGRSRVVTVVVFAVLALVVAAIPASAHRPDYRPHSGDDSAVVVAPRVSTADVCTGTLVVRFDTVQLWGHDWVPLRDDGSTRLELLEVSGRSGPGGSWGPPPSEWGLVVSGGEHVLRWSGWAAADRSGQHFALARVVTRHGYRSPGIPVTAGCGA